MDHRYPHPTAMGADTRSTYMSDVYQKRLGSTPPVPQPACATCPMSMWQSYADKVRCLCMLTRDVTWTKDEPQFWILECDGHEAALRKLDDEPLL